MEVRTITVKGNLGQRVNIDDLKNLGKCYYYKAYQPFIKIENNITSQIFKGGTVLIYGIKNETSVPYYWNKLIQILSPFIDISLIKSPEISNIVVTEKLGFNITLDNLLSLKKVEDIEYEPEIFPGLIWKSHGITYIIFKSGNISITGLHSEKEAKDAIDWIQKILIKYRTIKM